VRVWFIGQGALPFSIRDASKAILTDKLLIETMVVGVYATLVAWAAKRIVGERVELMWRRDWQTVGHPSISGDARRA
jgi:hypothetical protein